MARLAGHGLRREGAPYDDDGRLIAVGWVHSSGSGRARCECGALSEVLPSGNARKAWHRAHKAQIQRENRND